jgi:hypothetical protein
VPTERLLERLQPIEDIVQGRGNQLRQVVDILARGELGADRCGAGYRAAWERFS